MSPPRLLYLVTEDWFFCSHFLPMARAARAAGYAVAVATRCSKHRERIEAEGFRVVPFTWHRGSVNPLRVAATLRGLIAMIRRERPDIVHAIALKPVLLAGLVAPLAGIRHMVLAVTGLGLTFTAGTPKARLLRTAIHPLMRWIGRRPGAHLLVENKDHEARFLAQGWARPGAITRIWGAGVDLSAYNPAPPPDGEIMRVAIVSRMIAIKGVETAVQAIRGLADAGIAVELWLVGDPDEDSRAAITRDILQDWSRHPAIRWLGRRDDIPALWAEVDIALLPALGGDGLPKSLLEAAACGRPIVTTDTDGCREAVLPGENGFIVPPGDVQALAEALKALCMDAGLCHRFGQASRRMAEERFSEESVAGTVAALYGRISGTALQAP